MHVLKLQNLEHVKDGLIAREINGALYSLFQDCKDRPLLKKPRELTIKVTITPNGDEILDAARVGFQVNSKRPGFSYAREMKATSRLNGFGFSGDTDSVDHLDNQKTFED